MLMTGLHHIVLFCTDTKVAREWYERVGFTPMEGQGQGGSMYWFRVGDTGLLLHPAQKPSGGYVPALHVSVTDIHQLFRELVSKGLQPVDHQQAMAPVAAPVTRPWGDVEFDLLDPDGHRWAFTQI